MNSPRPRDWTQRHDGPPPLDAATVLVRSDRRLLLRAGLPTGLLAVFVAWASWEAGTLLAGSVLSGLLLAVSVARTVWWARGFGMRSLRSTSTHLMLCKADAVEQWVAWEDVERATIVHSDPLPEWSRARTDWFHVVPHPELAVMPPTALVAGFGDMLVSSRASREAADRVRSAFHARGIPGEEI